ncbi:sucrase ferredoxin [Rhodococcus pseudokoreensis]|uniref:Sucrase ferredoxin n=1 Tax=Rhodococcus pseudokoreensis TaxID=2811421 RepID=A0A974W145_9NOCA|nr:sucrase ferredoxin [Rhodococcus pseudokoreensis]QSE88939.1 sucrase ferredoxin [Rhodococcus pseudokoreensis]
MPDTITATCSALSATDEPLAGTAAHVRGWVCVEFPGAWGRDVLDGTALGPDLARELDARADAAGVRIMFIRRPGRGTASPDRRTVLLAQSHPARSWCERLEIGYAEDLLDLDLGLVAGPAPGLGAPVTDPVALVCAHGKRDQCCAVLGRPVAAGLAAEFGDAVWECSHTGGHRFAPSLILLPTGYTYGRLSAQESVDAVRAAARGEVYRSGLRGRSCWDTPGQVAELAVRDLVDAAADELTVDANSVVTHRDGRRWVVDLEQRELPPRPASCGAAPKPVRPVVATGVRALAP